MAQLIITGQKQYENDKEVDRSLTKKLTEVATFHDPLTEAKLALFSQKAKLDPTATKLKLASLKYNCQLQVFETLHFLSE